MDIIIAGNEAIIDMIKKTTVSVSDVMDRDRFMEFIREINNGKGQNEG